MTVNSFKKGLKDGLPICFGYLAVSFAFGIFARSCGLFPIQCLMISMTNVTSAGQLAAVPIMTGAGTLIEIAASQFVINLRYSLMSIALSQRLDKSVRVIDRLWMAFMNTDEIFAVSVSQEGKVGKKYFLGLVLTPWLGWSGGTILGALSGDILPAELVSALGLAIYAMFVAIVIPAARKEKAVALCCAIAMAFSCAFKYIKILEVVPSGFVIIICSVAASVILALVAPLKEGEE